MMNENQVLSNLNIHSFKELTSQASGLFTSMLKEMDPEVAKKALEQAPEFSRLARDVMGYLKEVTVEITKAESQSSAEYFHACQTSLNAYHNLLIDGNIDDDMKGVIIEKITEILNAMNRKDSEVRQNNNQRILFYGALGVTLVFVFAKAFLGIRKNSKL